MGFSLKFIKEMFNPSAPKIDQSHQLPAPIPVKPRQKTSMVFKRASEAGGHGHGLHVGLEVRVLNRNQETLPGILVRRHRNGTWGVRVPKLGVIRKKPQRILIACDK